MADNRLIAVRPDLAAAHLKGKVDAPRFVEGKRFIIAKGRASLRTRPNENASQDSELLFGQGFTVYDRNDGWAWGQACDDQYVGYVKEAVLAHPFAVDCKVTALLAPVFSCADLKTPVVDLLPMNAGVPVLETQGDYINVGPGFVHKRHLVPLVEKDFAEVAERFLGAPYVWGGKTVAGLDCSGLVQVALQAVGKAAPRDSDMMEQSLGQEVALSDISRGDLVFWKGHVGVMLDRCRLLHANAFHMSVAIEPLAQAVKRIQGAAGPVSCIKRL